MHVTTFWNSSRHLALAAMLFVFALSAVASLSSADKALGNNESFCTNAFLAPKGSPGSECGASAGGLLLNVYGDGVEHSMCVAYINGNNVNLSGWKCTSGPGGGLVVWTPNDGVWKRGDLKNNTTGSGTHVHGAQGCCY
jgi:hypothetical protein